MTSETAAGWDDWSDAETRWRSTTRTTSRREDDGPVERGGDAGRRRAPPARGQARRSPRPAALLDVAEELVDDPRAVRGVLGALGTVAGAASSLAGRGRDRGPDDDDPGVQRIPVS